MLFKSKSSFMMGNTDDLTWVDPHLRQVEEVTVFCFSTISHLMYLYISIKVSKTEPNHEMPLNITSRFVARKAATNGDAG